jgi:uncharacterized membrane protein YbhN (UPF0104 family)
METVGTGRNIIDSRAIRKRIISTLIRVGISVIVLSLIISLVKWKNALAAYHSADHRYILFGGLFIFANLGLRTLKWHTMLHSVKEKPSFWEAFGSVLLGISLGSFTPGEIGEFAGRALHVADAKKSHLVGLALLDKAQIFVVTSAAGSISLAILFLKDPLLAFFFSFCILFLSLLFFMRMDTLARIGHRLNASLFQKSWVTKVLDGFTLLDSGQLFTTLLYTICFHGILVVQMFLFIHAFSDITLSNAFLGTSAMMFVKSCLPISLGDLGIREAGSILFFSAFAISQAAALNASLLLFVVNILFPSICGTLFLHRQHSTAWTIFKSLAARTREHHHG